MVPWINRNSIDRAKFKLVDGGFFYKGKLYSFDDVIETRAAGTRFDLHNVLIGTDSQDAISVAFAMRSGDLVQLTEIPSWTSKGKPENVEAIRLMFYKVSKATLNNRKDKYEKTIKDHGCFEYQGWRFDRRDRSIRSLGTGKVFFIDDIDLLQHAGYIEVRSKRESLKEVMVRKIVDRPPGISTAVDPDLIVGLIKRFIVAVN